MQIKFYSFLKRLIIIIAIGISLYGCGVWTNFTTYFNTYYDASDLFSQAEDDINKQTTDIFSDEAAVSTSTGALLLKVEEKCSQILQFHAQSSFVDNSLFMIGKCFYYQGEYRKALRKFEELIATQPKSSLVLETRLWIGKCQMRLKDFDNSLTTLKDTREEAIKKGEREIAQDSFIEEIRYQIFKSDYNAAIELSKSFLTISHDDVLNADVAFEIGKLYNKINDYNNAVVYFQKVKEYSPTYDIRFNSLIEQGKALRKIGENDKALDIFIQLSKEKKYADVLDTIDYERGLTYLKMGKVEKAVDQFIFVDTTFSKNPSAGKSDYELGEIFLNDYKDFDSAAYYFNRTFTTAPPEYVNLARSSEDQLRKYEVLYDVVQFNNKQLTYALDSTAFIKDSIAYYTELIKKMRAARADSLRNKDEEIKKPTTVATRNNNQQLTTQPGQQPATQPQQQEQQQPEQPPATQSGQQQPEQPPATQPGQQQQGQPPATQPPGQQQPRQPQQLAGRQQLQLPQQAGPQDLLQWRQLKSESKPPVRPKVSIDTLTTEVVKSEFELGNLLFFDFNIPDSAYKYYTDIMVNYPASPYEGRVIFALGNYYLALNDTVKADSIFNVVYDKYKSEEIVNSAAIKLNKPLIDFEYDPAKPLYVEAESLMTKSNYDSCITSMYKIYLTHPKSQFASKALYAIGWMLENKNMNDSAAVIYDTLAKKYPRSIYTADVLPKLTFYNSEIERLKKEKQGSLLALSRPKSDTSSTDSLLIKKQKLSELATNTTNSNNSNAAQNKTKDENNPINNNAIVNPDTLIRNNGRGIRRITR